MKKILLIFLVFGFSCVIAFPQKDTASITTTFDDAEYFFASEEYQEALYLYLKLIKLQPENANFNFRTGMAYLNIPNQEAKAIPYLEKAVKNIAFDYRDKDLEETRAPHHAWFYLGNAYRINNDLDKALEAYNSFKGIKDFEKKYNVEIVDNEIKSCERAKIIKDSPLALVKTNLGPPVNTSNADYSPVLTPDESVLVYMNSQKFYEAIMYTKKVNGMWAAPVNINSQVKSDGDMRPTCLSADGKELYLVKLDDNNSDIYYSKFDGNLWSEAVPVNNYINSRSNETCASLSSDGRSLYFTSDRAKGIGGLDIYVSRKQSVGDWGPAENLGPVINTELDEESPYMSSNGKTLYFCSKGHFNMGGFDVFYATLNKYNQFEEAINLGYPVNTTNDNKGYYPLKDGKIGYMSLYDDSNIGKSDIYRLEILPSIPPRALPAFRFEKSFTMTLSDSISKQKIEIFYEKSTDSFSVKTSDGKKYEVGVDLK
jgi:tetratricopeptide (TPR) repeat protein